MTSIERELGREVTVDGCRESADQRNLHVAVAAVRSFAAVFGYARIASRHRGAVGAR